MAVVGNVNSPESALLMLSGGRDSFLAACRLFARGYRVHLCVFDNGCISSLNNVDNVVERLRQRFGDDFVLSYTVTPIASEVNTLRDPVVQTELVELTSKYPNLLLSQVNCLACHTSMYLHAIAQCLTCNISTIAEGAREQQRFFVELPPMHDRYQKLCKKYGIELLTPVYDLDSDMERKVELSQWGFTPKSYEPQCWVGLPLLNDLSSAQIESLENYYDREIEPRTEEIINILKVCKKGIQPSYKGYC